MAVAAGGGRRAGDWLRTGPAAAGGVGARLRGRGERGMRWAALAFGGISRALPIALRRPGMLVLGLGGAIPVLIMAGMVTALIRGKARHS